MWLLALDAGMRPGELYGLHWPEVDLEAGTVAVVHSLEEVGSEQRLKGVKTGGKGERTLALARRTVEALREHRGRMQKEKHDVEKGPVFPARRGGFLRRPNVYRRAFLPLVEAAGVPRIRVYDLRHTTATLLLQAGVNVKVVSERLGHTDIRMTLDTYAKVLPNMQTLAAECFDRLFPRMSPTSPPDASDPSNGKCHKA